jgi:hypothetical protein
MNWEGVPNWYSLPYSPKERNIMRFRISRPCWNKPHRCPGWTGGGYKYPKNSRCDNGRISTKPRIIRIGNFEPYETDHPGSNSWRIGKCNKCNVVTIPWALRYLDPRYYFS